MGKRIETAVVAYLLVSCEGEEFVSRQALSEVVEHAHVALLNSLVDLHAYTWYATVGSGFRSGCAG